MKLFTFRIGGVHPEENKLTADIATVEAELPKVAVFGPRGIVRGGRMPLPNQRR